METKDDKQNDMPEPQIGTKGLIIFGTTIIAVLVMVMIGAYLARPTKTHKCNSCGKVDFDANLWVIPRKVWLSDENMDDEIGKMSVYLHPECANVIRCICHNGWLHIDGKCDICSPKEQKGVKQ